MRNVHVLLHFLLANYVVLQKLSKYYSLLATLKIILHFSKGISDSDILIKSCHTLLEAVTMDIICHDIISLLFNI